MPDTVCENPGSEVTDDVEVPIITTLDGTEYVFVFVDDLAGGRVSKKITAANFKIWINTP